jgi:hypothetical protein
MDPVDILTMAVVAAQAVRSAAEPERVIVGAYGLLGREPPIDQDEAMAIRVARLMSEAGERRSDVLSYLSSNAGRLFMNRHEDGWQGTRRTEEAPIEPDPEAQRLLDLVDEGRLDAIPMFSLGFGPFEIAGRKMVGDFDVSLMMLSFGGRKERWLDSGYVPEREAVRELELSDLPVTVRGLIDYPIKSPVLFTIETGSSPWSLWDICCAFADQYDKIYEHPERYGIWGHDLTDLWIERLVYYPEERLIHPFVGS